MLRLSVGLVLSVFYCLVAVVQARPLQILTSIEPPFSFINQHQQLDGYAIDVVKRLQKTFTQPQDIEVKPWYQVYSQLAEQGNVVAFPVARTPERESLFYWIMPLSRNQHGIFSASAIKANSIADVANSGAIAVMRGDYRHQLLLKMGIENFAAFDTWGQAIKAVLAGEAASIFMSEAGLSHNCQREKLDCQTLKLAFSHDITNTYVALSKRGTSEQVAQQWLQAGQKLLKDKAFHNAAIRWARHYQQQYQQDMHFAVGALNLWAQQTKLNFMALYPQAVPTIYQHPDSGEVKGIVPDILSGFSYKHGIEINYSFVNRGYSETALYEGKTDAILLSRQWARQSEKLVFSDSLFEHGDYLLGLQSFGRDKAMKLEQLGTLCSRAQFVYPKLQHWFESGQVIRLDASSDSEILNLLSAGRCDYGILNQYTANWIKFNFADEISLHLSTQPLDVVPLNIALNRHNAKLLAPLNRHITHLKKSGQLQEIIQRNIRVKLDFPRHSVLPAF